MQTIAIIGGGAAGMMAAASLCASNSDVRVILIEKNSCLGKKVMLTGGGRCNFTTGLDDVAEVLENYPRGARFLRFAMHEFSPLAMREFMEEHGVPVKIEDDGRAFPKSDNSHHVVRVFEKILEDAGAEVLLKTGVLAVQKNGDEFELDLDNGERLKADRVIITTGGAGHKFAQELGHTITSLSGSLNPFRVAESWVKQLSGLAFENVRLKMAEHDFTGPILFTHKGVSGPGVFALSALSAYEKLPADLILDFFPAEGYEALLARISRACVDEAKKDFANVLSQFVPKSFAAKFAPQKKCHELSKKDLNKVVESLKNLKLRVTGKTAGDEFVTAGGVKLQEVNPKTMESKVCPGLYLAGELLDIDGFTGGFNLQAAWATGRLAGKTILK
jgi:predicted Rossmann fold flavoprotein